MLKKVKPVVAIIAVSSLIACGGGGGAESTQTGSFINSPTKGVRYVASPSGLSGVTDENGNFSYRAGDTVTFSLDLGATTVQLGSIVNPGAQTSVLSLAVPGGGGALAVAQLLESLDKSSVDGKMDVSGISLPSGNAAIAAISTALSGGTIPAASIATISAAVQTVVASSGGTLKYGSDGVSFNEALNNLAVNPANRALVEAKVESLPHDGVSTFLALQDKTAFVNSVTTRGGQTDYEALFGVIKSNLEWDFRVPDSATSDLRKNGTYTLSNGNRTGNWTLAGTSYSGTFNIKSLDNNAFVYTTTDTSTGDTGSTTGTILQPFTLSDVLGKSFRLVRNCPNGADNVVTVNNSGVTSDTCGTNLNGATWSAGPLTNVLKLQASDGKVSYIGITRLRKNGGGGNLPTGATGSYISISKSNYTDRPVPLPFVVQ